MFRDLIEGFVKDQIKNQITKTIGIDDVSADGAIHDVIGSLVGGLAKNTQNSEGLQSLIQALDKDHDGSILDDVVVIMQSEDKGKAIINHILGNKQEGIAQLIGTKNGIDSAQATKILTLLAPIVMGYLGKQKQSAGLSADNVGSLLQKEADEVRQEKAESPMIAFLDQDGDGDVDMIDFLKMAS